MSDRAFDYERKVWGAHELTTRPTDLGALRLVHCLTALRDARGPVLEIGCGAGQFARAVRRARPDLAIVGCDISATALAAASARDGTIRYTRADGERLGFHDGAFGAVVLFDVLEHVPNPDRLLAECRRVLRDGGIFHAFVPCEASLLTLHGLAHRVGWTPKRRYAGHIQQFTPAELRELLTRSGLAVVEESYSLHLVNQLFDLSYFTALSLARRQVPQNLEGLSSASANTAGGRLLRAATAGVAVASFVESRLLRRVPGLGVHVTARARW